MKTIKIEGVKKVINNNDILKNINIEFESGKIYGVYGHNGSGKTMLFRTISGLIKPTEGKVIIFNDILHKDIDFPKSIGVVIENLNFWPNYTAREVLETLANIKNIIDSNDIDKTLTRVGLDPRDGRTIKKYSLGMKQRLAIAQAIMEKPEIIILDEPTNALDEDGVKLVYEILREEKKRGALILISSHNKKDIEILSDYKIEISNGTIKEVIGEINE